MSTYKCARELEGHILKRHDVIMFSDVGNYTVESSFSGWYLSKELGLNRAVLLYLGAGDTQEDVEEFVKSIGGELTDAEGGFPYVNSAENLTTVARNLLLKVEQKRLAEFDFDSYHPKGKLIRLTKEQIRKLLTNQVQQGNVLNPKVFDKAIVCSSCDGGMDWNKSIEGFMYWKDVTSPPSASTSTDDHYANYKNDYSVVVLSTKRRKPKLKTL